MTVQKMKKDRVIKFDSKERILKKVRSYVESVETFFDENDRAGNWGPENWEIGVREYF